MPCAELLEAVLGAMQHMIFHLELWLTIMVCIAFVFVKVKLSKSKQ